VPLFVLYSWCMGRGQGSDGVVLRRGRGASVSSDGKMLFRNQTLLDKAGDPAFKEDYQIMVDMDSILFPILAAMASRPGGTRVKAEDIPTWTSLAGLVDGGVPRMLEIFDEVMEWDVMREFPPMPGAAESLATLRAHGCGLHVKTDRKEQFAASAERYLTHFGLPYDTFLCAPGIDKLAICQAEGIGTIVDDHPDLLDRAARAGLDALSLHYPYNVEVAQLHELKTAHSWPDLAMHAAGAVEKRIKQRLRSLAGA